MNYEKHIEDFKQVEKMKLKNPGVGMMDLVGVLVIAVMIAAIAGLFIAGNARRPGQAITSYPTEIPTLPSQFVATSLQLQPTPTLAPTAAATHTPTPTATGTVTPLPTAIATATNTAVSSATPQATYTPLPTYTIPPTWTPPPTAVPTFTPDPSPTRPVLLAMVPPTAVPITHMVNELEDTRQSLMLVGGVTSSLFLLSVSVLVLAVRGLRRPVPPQVTITPADTAEAPPTRLILPPPVGQPLREPVRDTSLTGLTGSEPVQDTGSQTITLRVEPVQGEADEALIRELWGIWVELPKRGERQSINNVCFTKWGGKNPQRMLLVRRAISWGEGQERQRQTQRPLTINTTKGRVEA